MTDSELAALLAANEAAAIDQYTSEIAGDQEKAINYYYGRPLGGEVAGKSQVVDHTVAIVIDNAVAAILKPFVSADDAVAFEPVGPEDEDAAKQATEYVNYVFNVDNPGFILLHNWFKAALLEKVGIVKVWWEGREIPRRVRQEGLSADQVEQLQAFATQSDAGFSIIGGPYQDGEFYAVDIEKIERDGRIKVQTVPSEEFLIAPFSRDIETTGYCAHRPMNITRSDLIDMGLDADVVEGLPAAAQDASHDPRSMARTQDENFASSRAVAGLNDKSRDLINIIDEYVLVDFDGDGVAERRRVVRCGGEILLNIEVEDNPFALLCPVPMPHKVFGLSLADQTIDLQEISSILWRGILDNLYLSNEPKMELPVAAERPDGSTADDMAETGPGVVIRTQVGGQINAIEVPFTADKAFPMLEYAERQQEARTGISRNGQGLDTNALRKGGQMTATEAADLISGKNSRSEMIARIFAETGVKRLFRLMLKLLVNHQPKSRMIRLRNKWVEIDPRSWNAEMDMSISVGLGVGSQQEKIAQADSILQTLAEVAATPYGSMITDENAYHAVKKKIAAAGAKDVENYITEPPKGPDGQPLPKPPPPDPKMVEVQAKAQAQAQQQQFDQQKAAWELEQAQAEGAAKIDLMREEAAAKLQLERERAAAEAALAQQSADREYALAVQAQERDFELRSKQAERDHELAIKKQDALPKNRPGGDLNK